MDKTVMVTGGNGFLGSYVSCHLAERGYQVVSYDVAQPRPQTEFIQQPFKNSIRYVNGQVTDLSRFLSVCKSMNVARVVHCAASLDVSGSTEQPYATYMVNTLGAVTVYEAARLLDLERVVLISSNAVYHRKQYEPMDELHPVFSPSSGNPATHYGASKVAAEVIGLTYFTFNGVDLLILRMASMYGFGTQNPMYIKPMVENSVLGLQTNFPTGTEMVRDYTYVKDSAAAVLKALEADGAALSQRVFNTSAGRLYSAGEVARIVREVLPDARIEIGSGLSDLERSDIQARGALDCRKAKEELGYAPAYDLRSGVRDYVSMLRSYLQSGGRLWSLA